MSIEPTLQTKRDRFASFARDRVPLAFAHENDRATLLRELGPARGSNDGLHLLNPEVMWIDAQLWADVAAATDEGRSLSERYRRLGWGELKGAHAAVPDARAAARVLFAVGQMRGFQKHGPATYADLVRFQTAIQLNRGELFRLAEQRIEQSKATLERTRSVNTAR